MARINLLSSALSNMIAAGEVVERPSSVVKELLENALDAQATQIDIIVEDAGKKLIEVIDNGTGMESQDALMAFKRHATSKIFSEHDLNNIATLGFRGEALPSIAAVSEVEIITSTGDVGTRVVDKASEVILNEPANARKGTTIKVKELFYNTPARLKHLKSNYSEQASIVDVVTYLALGYPHVKFNLICDGKPLFTSIGNGNVLEVLAKTFGVDVARNMIEVNFADYDFKVSGYISKIQANRGNKYGVVTLLNGRYVRINSAANALIEAYNTYIPKDRYPYAVLCIEVDPYLVDINVHPSKQVVRLSKEDELANLVKLHVAQALQSTMQIPNYTKKEVKQEEWIQPTLDFDAESFMPLAEDCDVQEKPIELPIEKPIEKPHLPFYLRVIGQFHGTYILVESDDGLLLVDQHAGAERINFERFSKMLGTNEASISLLIPLILDYPVKEIAIILEKIDILKSVGIIIEPFGPTSIRISEVPCYMSDVNLQVYVDEVIQLLFKNVDISVALIRQHAIATIACKASIKANHALSNEEAEQLIIKLFTCQNPYTCPHGRPTLIKYTNYELEKHFKR